MALRIRRHGSLLSCSLLRAARFLAHFALCLHRKIFPDGKQTHGALGGVLFLRAGRIPLRRRLSLPVRGILRLRGLLRRLLRRLHGGIGIPERIQSRSIRRGKIRRRGLRLRCTFAIFRRALRGVNEIRAPENEQRENDITADRRRQFDDGIHDEPSDDAAARREEKAVFAGTVTSREIIPVAVIGDAARLRRDGMHEADQEDKQKRAQKHPSARSGGFFPADEHAPAVNERGKDRIRAIAEHTQQKRAYGKAHFAEDRPARNEKHERNDRKQDQNDPRRFPREYPLSVIFIF